MSKLFCYTLFILSFGLAYCVDPLFKKSDCNVIIVTRDVGEDSVGYNRLDEAEINLIFAQLSRCFMCASDEDAGVRAKLEEKVADSVLARDILSCFEDSSSSAMNCKVDHGKYSIVLFNEMFFSKDEALTKEEVDKIVNCYRAFSFPRNTLAYINFLYKDNIKPEYKEQLAVSNAVYNGIFAWFNKWDYPFMNFMGEGVQQQLISLESPGMRYYKNYIEQAMKGVSTFFAAELLFNQTKIFLGMEEIGYYNKSSYCMESLSDFKEGDKFKHIGVPFYVIGNFDTTLSSSAAPIHVINSLQNLVCYDMDVRRNFHPSMAEKNTFLFASNTYPTDLISLNNGMWICADSKGIDFSWCEAPFTAHGLNEDSVAEEEEEEKEEERSVKQRFVRPEFYDLPSVSGIFDKNDATITPIKQKGLLEFNVGNNKYKIRIFDVKLTLATKASTLRREKLIREE